MAKVLDSVSMVMGLNIHTGHVSILKLKGDLHSSQFAQYTEL